MSTGLRAISSALSALLHEAVQVVTFGSGGIESGVKATAITGSRQLAQSVTFQTGASATGTTLIPLDNTIPQITEGDQYMALAFTPTNVLSTLEIEVIWVGSGNTAGMMIVALFQDAIANALAAVVQSFASGAGQMITAPLKYSMAAGTTSTITFRVRAGIHVAGTTYFNTSLGSAVLGGVVASRITIKEYLP